MSSASKVSSSSLTSSPYKPLPPNFHPFDVDYFLEKIFSHLGNKNDLIKYRFVSHKWNDVIVKITKSAGNSFNIPLHYGPEVPMSFGKSEARLRARETLEIAITTLRGTATALSFDTVVVDQDFYLAGATVQWINFLEIQGEFIRHLKFDIRSGEGPGSSESHLTDCEEVVSRNNLRAAFLFAPNLESLDLSIRFTHYASKTSVLRRRFPEGPKVKELTQLEKLSKIRIQEPYEIGYTLDFLKEIIGMAPNLSTLDYKYSVDLSNFTVFLNDSLYLCRPSTIIGISGPKYGLVKELCDFGFISELRLNEKLAEGPAMKIIGMTFCGIDKHA